MACLDIWKDRSSKRRQDPIMTMSSPPPFAETSGACIAGCHLGEGASVLRRMVNVLPNT
jgi:hypothetical protein